MTQSAIYSVPQSGLNALHAIRDPRADLTSILTLLYTLTIHRTLNVDNVIQNADVVATCFDTNG